VICNTETTQHHPMPNVPMTPAERIDEERSQP